MPNPDIRSRVRRLIVQTFRLPGGDVGESTSIASLLYDSLDYIELIIKLEDSFGVRISDEVAENWYSVGDIADWMERQF